MKVQLLFVLLSLCCMNSVDCGIYQVWGPNSLQEAWSNNTKMISDFVKSRTIAVSAVLNNYVDAAKNTTVTLKKNVENYFVDKRDIVNNTITEYFNKAKNATKDFADIKMFKPKKDCENVDPEVLMTTPEIISRNGYASEAHTVETQDGYLITLHRIPRAKETPEGTVGKQAVFLQHGLMGSSADYVIGGPKQALAYILADAGYDVWLGNVRGNTYSRAHVNLSITDRAFWNFTWHEVGYYDLPAAIDHVNAVKKTDKETIYIGHSMGTSVLFVLLSTRPEYNAKLRAAFAMAPVVYMTAIKSPIRLLAPFANDIELLTRLLGNGEFLPQSQILKWLARFGCEINTLEEEICENAIFVLCGYDAKQFNRTLLPLILSHTPAGASTKTLVHYAQEIESKGNFQRYDYGHEGNLKEYGQKMPLEYPLEKITLPIGLFVANNDWLSGSIDAKKLYKRLNNPIEYYEVPFKEFNHLDFLWGVDAPKLLYGKLLESLGNYKVDNGVLWSFSPKNFMLKWNL